MACIVEINQIKEFINNNNLLALKMYNTNDEDLKKVLIEFNAPTLNVMRNIKQRTDISGPSKFIDFDFEKELKQKSR